VLTAPAAIRPPPPAQPPRVQPPPGARAAAVAEPPPGQAPPIARPAPGQAPWTPPPAPRPATAAPPGQAPPFQPPPAPRPAPAGPPVSPPGAPFPPPRTAAPAEPPAAPPAQPPPAPSGAPATEPPEPPELPPPPPRPAVLAQPTVAPAVPTLASQHWAPAAPAAPATPPVSPARLRRLRRRRLLAAAAGVTVLLLVGLGFLAARAVGPVADTRPAGVTDHAVLQAVAQRFTGCANDTGSSPTNMDNCPQLGFRHNSPTEDWQLKGDPTLGAGVRYVGGHRFTVNGRYVMVLEGDDTQQNLRFFPQVDASPYVASVLWSTGQLHVSRIDRAPQGPAVPRPQDATDDQALLSARVTFKDECTGTRQLANPTPSIESQQCPYGLFQPCGNSTAKNTVTQDPNGAPQVRYTPEGIVHVTGHYAQDQTVTSTTPGCTPTRTGHATGSYDLAMVWNGDSFDTIESTFRQDQQG
jgi:hypothetical protein